MYTPSAFRMNDEAAWAFVAERAFGAVVAVSEAGPVASHVPLEVSSPQRRLVFHVARTNPLHEALSAHPGALIIVSGPDAYVSPDWYASADQVPTWNYVSVHLSGKAQVLPAADALAHVDNLSRQFETRLAGKKPWTLAKLPAARRDALLKAIVPVAFTVERIEAQWKLSQNKTYADQEKLRKMLEWRGDWHSVALAHVMRQRLAPASAAGGSADARGGADIMKTINPPDIVPPASNYAQGVLHAAASQRLVISGQVGVRPDGTVEQGLEAQMERAWSNLLGVLRAAGFEKRNLVKATVFVTEPGQVALFRAMRDRVLEGHACAFTYLQVAGLASPDFLVEIEAEAVRE